MYFMTYILNVVATYAGSNMSIYKPFGYKLIEAKENWPQAPTFTMFYVRVLV